VRTPPVRVRLLRNPAEFLEASRVAKAAWGFPDLMVPPPPDMITATHSGGMTAGAFQAGCLLAFVHAVPRTNLPQPAIHSHLLAVRPDAQGRGLSVRLKLFQREWCLARGIGLVTWTYDPFMLRNARLNLVRLGAVSPVFIPNFYGAIGGIYGELPSDRFEAHWRLGSPSVERAARGGRGTERGSKGRGSGPFSVVTENGPDPQRHEDPQDDGLQRKTDLTPYPPYRVLPFPAGFPGVFLDDVAAGIAARRRFGRAAAALFAEGYEAVSVTTWGGGPAYVLERR
jgi:predicted GNAT superfamily acetyltransferase